MLSAIIEVKNGLAYWAGTDSVLLLDAVYLRPGVWYKVCCNGNRRLVAEIHLNGSGRVRTLDITDDGVYCLDLFEPYKVTRTVPPNVKQLIQSVVDGLVLLQHAPIELEALALEGAMIPKDLRRRPDSEVFTDGMTQRDGRFTDATYVIHVRRRPQIGFKEGPPGHAPNNIEIIQIWIRTTADMRRLCDILRSLEIVLPEYET